MQAINTYNDDHRYQQLCDWLTAHAVHFSGITALPNDASFRRYFRIQWQQQSLIVMDAPPDKEDMQPFVGVDTLFANLGLHVPQIHISDLKNGFLLLSDLGNDLFARILTSDNADQLYQAAINALLIIQTCPQDQGWHFPIFNHSALLEELTRFHDWYLLKHLDLKLTTAEEHKLAQLFSQLVELACQQPQLCVHRDYHSRNLMALANNNVGILDFQDAVWGPITYDLVSLLRDCYIAWPDTKVQNWLQYYYQLARDQQILANISVTEFSRYFDWMGIQRHLKAIYIFARKFRRDSNASYLGDIPRTLHYIFAISQRYPELNFLPQFLQSRIFEHQPEINL